MKSLIKKIIAYDKIYDIVKTSFVYQVWKKLIGLSANVLNGYPSKEFFIIGVTGTNGKTTTVNLIHKLLNDNVGPTVMISTAVIKIGNQEIENKKKMTSLDVFDLQSILSTAKSKGCKIAVLEVSSHGLDQYRFEGVEFDFAILTNITHDHLDYHGTFENYANVKKQLFKYVIRNKKANKYASFPYDDKIGRQWNEEMPFDKKITFGINSSCVLRAENIVENLNGSHFDLVYLGNSYPMHTTLPGTYNIYNIMAAISVAVQIGLDIRKAIQSLESFGGVAGRMERVEKNGVSYFVDFAHSPDALEKTLTFLKSIKGNGRLIVVFGAPGNRDKTKRPEMGRIAGENADIMIATDDDADTENRLKILEQLTAQIRNEKNLNGKTFVIPERLLAIQFAVDIAKPGDIVMLAGKGHELIHYTNFGRRKWSDKIVLLDTLNRKTD